MLSVQFSDSSDYLAEHQSRSLDKRLLIFGREPKTKLPSMRNYELLKTSVTDVSVRERDSDKKFAMKSYADERNCNNSMVIYVGDTVLVRNDDK
ncbi:hypothetical protein KP79_PYT26171 [Mizuhopecten yessoensis]|uniref:Uncharacterized protein n=1 Tax=Mizuhopecten yessoensis TaxID=6573 RepID=A0A210QFH3_MIZYE|nr:hypothetical protein KP79_PYT26171 [Mizuhopecten yessoensis]